MRITRHITGVLALLAALAAPLSGAADAERKFEGLVLRTHVTLCQLKPRGCAGYMDVETERAGRRERWTVQVRLGVPIRYGDDYVYLATLDRNVVSVTHVSENGAIVARSIEVLKRATP
jgi:hypothetical protein